MQKKNHMTEKSNSAYLKSERLGDVIAAIQVMGKYAFYKLDFAKWSMRISGDTSKENHWKIVFSEHPEFFRFNSEGTKASLAWRRSYRKRFQVDEQRDIEFSEYENLTTEQKKRISRTPLTGEEVSILINTAINLHTRAIEQNKEHRWLSSPLFSLLGVVLGAFLVWLGK
jgi:hypothetical protein